MTISDYKKIITDEFMGNATVQAMYGLPASASFEAHFSKVSIESILFDVAAFVSWLLGSLFETHKSEVTAEIEKMRFGYTPWYVEMAKAFQYGYSLPYGAIYYNNSGLTEAQIAAAKVVKHAAASGALRGIRLKVAGEDASGSLAPLPTAQFNAFKSYMEKIKGVGVRVYYTNDAADVLNVNLKIYYDPMVLDGTGARLDGTAPSPVMDALNAYLKNTPFNGAIRLVDMVDALQAVDGVAIPQLLGVTAGYAAVTGLPVDVIYNPNAGYCVLGIVNIQYLPNAPV